MSARVKGWNSGGPVINKLGEVIGMISASPSSDSQEIDRLRFATAIASSEIEEFLSEIANEVDCVGQVNFQVVEGHLEARTERAVARLKVERIHFRKKIQPSTVPEFGSVHLGNIGKHLSQKEVQAAIPELGRVIDEDRRSSEEGRPPH